MGYVIILIAALISAGIGAGMIVAVLYKERGGIARNIGNLKDEVDEKIEFKKKIEGLYAEMIDVGSLQQIAGELRGLEESLKAERGRITITQAELETVETRLRELEEIERELEASALETKEEFSILKKKEGELRKSNTELTQKIEEAQKRLAELLNEIELSAQVQEQMTNMQTELLRTQEQIDILLLQVEQGNDQYFILKKRYDALDIEYAQLYEKFSLAEESSGDD